MRRLAMSLLLAALSVPLAGQADLLAPKFSVDPASPSIDGAITPDDVLVPGPAVFIEGTDLGLVDDFFSGLFDNLNALSFGKDPIRTPLFFSVDRVAVGLPDTDVFSEAAPASEEAAGDVYRSLPPVVDNALVIDEEDLGLVPGFFGDDLDALSLDGVPTPFVYFSVDFLSLSADPTDILVSDGSGGFSVCADGETAIGLDAADDIDALVLLDRDLDGECDPLVDLALFSLSTFSPSTFTGGAGPWSPADVLITDFSGSFSLFASAASLGLRDDDELDALDTIPEPASGLLAAAGLVAVGVARRRRWSRKR